MLWECIMFCFVDVCDSVCNMMIAFINVKVVYYYWLRVYAFCLSLECIIAHYFSFLCSISFCMYLFDDFWPVYRQGHFYSPYIYYECYGLVPSINPLNRSALTLFVLFKQISSGRILNLFGLCFDFLNHLQKPSRLTHNLAVFIDTHTHPYT